MLNIHRYPRVQNLSVFQSCEATIPNLRPLHCEVSSYNGASAWHFKVSACNVDESDCAVGVLSCHHEVSAYNVEDFSWNIEIPA